jgi:hypothetical protein
MGVVTDDQVHQPGTRQLRGERQLLGIGRLLVLRPPVQGQDHRLRTLRPGPPGIGQDLVHVDQVRPPALPAGVGEAVETVGVREESDLDAVRVQPGDALRFRPGPGRSGMRDAGCVQPGQRPGDPGRPLIEGVIAGRAAHVVAGRLQRRHHLGRAREHRIPGERPRSGRQRRLEMAHAQIGRPHVRSHRGQHRREIHRLPAGLPGVPAGLGPGPFMQEDVAGRHQGEAARGRDGGCSGEGGGGSRGGDVVGRLTGRRQPGSAGTGRHRDQDRGNDPQSKRFRKMLRCRPFRHDDAPCRLRTRSSGTNRCPRARVRQHESSGHGSGQATASRRGHTLRTNQPAPSHHTRSITDQ